MESGYEGRTLAARAASGWNGIAAAARDSNSRRRRRLVRTGPQPQYCDERERGYAKDEEGVRGDLGGREPPYHRGCCPKDWEDEEQVSALGGIPAAHRRVDD